jgi:ribosome-associated protein
LTHVLQGASHLSPDQKQTLADAPAYAPALDANDADLSAPALEADAAAQETPGPQSADDFDEVAHPGGDPEDLLALIEAKLDDDQAQDVVVIDLRGKSPIADYIVVASGRSQRHVGALSDHLARALKTQGYGKAHIEGMPQADWVLIDAGDVIVHLFRPEVRAFYRIEQIWSHETPGVAPRPEGAGSHVALGDL